MAEEPARQQGRFSAFHQGTSARPCAPWQCLTLSLRAPEVLSAPTPLAPLLQHEGEPVSRQKL